LKDLFKIKLFLTILLIIPFINIAQGSQNFDNQGYIETMRDKLNVKFEIDNDVQSFEFNDGNSNFRIIPNTNLRTTISVNHDFLTLKVGYSPKFLGGSDSDEKGETKVLKIKMDLFMKNWMQTFEYSLVKGYYLDGFIDPLNQFLPTDTEYIILPDLKTSIIQGTTRYKLNSNFSLKAITNQFEIQRKSAGSFVPSLTYGYFNFSDESNPQDISSFGVNLNTGYFYTFVINRTWFANLGISPGIGMEFNKLTTKLDDDIDISRNTDLIFNIRTNMGLGYNSKTFFGGFVLVGVATQRNENSIIKFNNVRGIMQIFIGYRFQSPKFIDKTFDWLDKKNPFK
jgi:hypothetical protein